MLDWIDHNKEWLFSGLGVTFIAGIVGLLWKQRARGGDPRSVRQKQKGGKGSTNLQIGNIDRKD